MEEEEEDATPLPVQQAYPFVVGFVAGTGTMAVNLLTFAPNFHSLTIAFNNLHLRLDWRFSFGYFCIHVA